MKSFLAVLSLAAFTLLSPLLSQAGLISGELGINGNLTDSFPVASVVNGTNITFKNAGASLVVNLTAGSTFENEGVATLTPASYFDFTVGTPLSPLWTIATGGFSFDLLASQVLAAGPFGFILQGSGIMNGTGYDPTPYAWSLVATKSSPTSTNVSFTAQNSQAVVPEPSSMILLGSGLALLAFSKFLKRPAL